MMFRLRVALILSVFLLVAVDGKVYGVSYDVEPNGTFATASALPLDVTGTGSLHGYNDVEDWYQMVVPSDGEMTITATHNSPSDFQFILYGSTEQVSIIGTETNAASGRQLSRTVAAGTYHVRVKGRQFTDATTLYEIRVDLNVSPAVTDDVENNDTYATAGTLTLDAAQTGHISYTWDNGTQDNLDYYSLAIPEDATVTFTVSHDPSEYDFQFVVYGADGTTSIFGTETNFPSGDSRVRHLAAGTYYLEINGRGRVEGRTYYCNVSTDAHPSAPSDIEPNDSFGAAKALNMDVKTKGHISFTQDSTAVDNLDYWSFTLPGTTTQGVWLTLTHDPIGYDFQFAVYDAGQNPVAGTETNAGSPRKLEFTTNPGAHYLLVNGRGRTVGRTYEISSVIYDPAVGTPTPTPVATDTPTPIPVVTPNSIHSDVNNDGYVDLDDVLILHSDWHKRVDPRGE